MIVDEQMTPERIARLFASSASKNAGRDVALIVLAGSVARYRAQPQDWSAEIERSLANKVAGPVANDALAAEHLALALRAIGIEEGPVDAGRLIDDWVGHQSHNCAYALMPTQDVV
jgi:hypothetical protein